MLFISLSSWFDVVIVIEYFGDITTLLYSLCNVSYGQKIKTRLELSVLSGLFSDNQFQWSVSGS